MQKRILDKMGLRNIAINVTLAACIMIFMLFIAEMLLFMFYPQITVTLLRRQGSENASDPVLGWTHYRNSSIEIRKAEYDNVYFTNEEGMNDINWDLEKYDDEIRIAFVGDSFTDATNIPQDKRFTSLLQQEINNNDMAQEYTIMNFAIDGYSTCQEYMMVMNRTLKYNPDVVVLGFFMGNDFTDNLDYSGIRPICFFRDYNQGFLKAVKYPTKFKAEDNDTIIEKMAKNTNLGTLFLNTFRYSRISYLLSSMTGHKPEYEKSKLFDVRLEKENLKEMYETFMIIKGMDADLKEKNITFIVLIMPDIIQADAKVWGDIRNKYGYDQHAYDLDFPNRELEKFLDENNIAYLDVTEPIRDMTSQGQPMYFPNDRHFNEDGHFITAMMLYHYLREESDIIKIKQ